MSGLTITLRTKPAYPRTGLCTHQFEKYAAKEDTVRSFGVDTSTFRIIPLWWLCGRMTTIQLNPVRHFNFHQTHKLLGKLKQWLQCFTCPK